MYYACAARIARIRCETRTTGLQECRKNCGFMEKEAKKATSSELILTYYSRQKYSFDFTPQQCHPDPQSVFVFICRKVLSPFTPTMFHPHDVY